MLMRKMTNSRPMPRHLLMSPGMGDELQVELAPSAPITCRVEMFDGGRPARVAPSRLLELNASFCLGETRHYFNQCDLFRSFHVIVEVQFEGLARLDRAVNNYKDNLNSLYQHPDLTLTVDRALHNVIVSAYSHYIDTWAMNGACVGHCTVLMRSMLKFAMHFGHYRH